MGGIGIYVRELYDKLTERGVSASIVALTPPGAREAGISQDGSFRVVRAEQLPFPHDFIANFNLQNFVGLKGFIKLGTSDLDVIDAQGYPLGLAAAAASELTHTPFVWHSHNLLCDNNADSAMGEFFRKVEGYLATQSTHTIAVSHFIAERIHDLFGTANDKITVIEKPADRELFDLPRRAKKSGQTILYVGRISPEKGVHILMDAMGDCVKRFPDIRLQLVGAASNDEYLKDILAQVKNHGLQKNVVFLGAKFGKELHELITYANLVVVPSLGDAFPRVTIEAMAAGVPVVASDVGGIKEMIEDGVTGTKVVPNDSKKLAEAIVLVLSNLDLASGMADKAKEVVRKKYTWENVLTRTLSVYSRMVDSTEGKLELTAQ
jgi:glycogen(starch) synthase